MSACDHEWTVSGRWHLPVPGCEDPLRLVCRRCMEGRGIRCGTSRSSRCEPCAATYRQRVAVVAGSGAEVLGVRGLFATVTAPGAAAHFHADGRRCRCTPEGGVDLATWNASAAARFNRFLQELSRKMDADIITFDAEGKKSRVRGLTYFKAAEVQRRGALHYHVMIKRLDGKPSRLSRALLRRIAVRHGFGHSVDVQRLEPGHAQYVAKYVAKASNERQDVPWSGKSYEKPINPHHKVLRARGEVVDVRTGEIVGNATPALVTVASYRTWSKARSWGRSMREVRADQQHHVLTLLVLPAWAERPTSPGWAHLDVPIRSSQPDAVPI